MNVLCSTETGCEHSGTSSADRAAVRSVWRSPRSALAAGLVRLRAWVRRPAERRALASLSDRYLRDIGLTPADVEAERHHLGLGQSIESIRYREHL